MMDNIQVSPIAHWRGDMLGDTQHHTNYAKQETFWLWSGQVGKQFMCDRYSLEYTELNKYIKQHGKQTAKVLEKRYKARRKEKRIKMCLEWLSDEYGIPYTRLYQRYHRGDRGQGLIRGNRKRVGCE